MNKKLDKSKNFVYNLNTKNNYYIYMSITQTTKYLLGFCGNDYSDQYFLLELKKNTVEEIKKIQSELPNDTIKIIKNIKLWQTFGGSQKEFHQDLGYVYDKEKRFDDYIWFNKTPIIDCYTYVNIEIHKDTISFTVEWSNDKERIFISNEDLANF